MALHGNMMLAPAGGYSGYQIDQSAVFDGSSDYLSWTPPSQGDTRTFTISCLVRRFNGDMIYSAGTGTSFVELLQFANDKIRYAFYNGSTYAIFIETDAVFRDYSSWYHIVLAVDTTAATSSDRVKIWVNGVLQSVDSSRYSGYGSQNTDVATNRTNLHHIAKYVNYPAYGGLGIADFRFIDGQAYEATDFGEFYNGTTAWRPIEPSGLTVGTNGFYLPFTQDTPNLGVDYSGNGNDWTENGSPVQSGDSPTVNCCTWNPLSNDSSVLLSNGNRDSTSGSGAVWISNYATQELRGKKYAELKLNSIGSGSSQFWGLSKIQPHNGTSETPHTTDEAWGIYWDVSNFLGEYHNSAGTDRSNPAVNDIYQIAFDEPNGDLWLGYNNTWIGGGDPGAGTSPTYSGLSSDTGWTLVIAFYTGYTSDTTTLNCGQEAFTHTPPTGFTAPTAANLPEVTITDPGEYFNVVGYTGDGTAIGSGGNSITGVGFQSDFTWIKNRDQADSHMLFDVIRGATKVLHSDSTAAETTESETLDSFDSDGFTLGSDVEVNTNTEDYISWNWKAGGAGVANTDGTISSTVSVNDDAGFSIVGFEGTGSAGTVGHGQSGALEMIIVKNRSDVAHWPVYHKDVGPTNILWQNLTDAQTSASSRFNSTDPTSSVFSVGNDNETNGSTDDIIAYCFRSIPGYSKVFSYTGNGSADGPFVYLGFRPRFVLVKRSDSTGNWFIWDTERDPDNTVLNELYPDSSSAEVTRTGSSDSFDIISNGIKMRFSSTYADRNASGGTYIGIAFAENPFGGSNIPLGLAQ